MVDYFEFYLDAFRELSSARQLGMAIGPIPFTAIHEYSKLYDVGEFHDFLYLIRKMDDTFLELVNKKDEPKKKPKAKSGKK